MTVGRSRSRCSRNRLRCVSVLAMPEVILKLLVEPAFGAGVESDRETDRHLGLIPARNVQDAGQSLATHAEPTSNAPIAAHL
jgi:hypothetical protein